jgi:hypothetical protein
MRTRLMLLVTVLVALSTNLAPASVIRVPEDYTNIQDAIDVASDGDVISVWGPPPGQPSVPPWTYHENVDFQGLSILVVNRSFLGQTPGYDSSWDYVIIDGGQNGSVVSMTGAASPVLKGFTIQNGHTSGYGGGVSCNAGAILKNHILNNYAASGGGEVFYSAQVQK